MILDKLIDAASFSPHSLQSPNAWVGHLPFAAWIIQEIKPKIFVELGTHTGNSYFSICQSVIESGIPTKCYAVDTWQGDEHAGLYNDDVFAKVNAHHQEHYAGFSRLLRMTFDDAVSYFSDASIDFLHIDGLHTYEAVLHDFETWLPKLAPGAVVIFHDTNVRERNFGVWKLWEELQERYPNNLEFVHSHGLGVLQLNDAPVDKKLEWIEPNSTEKNSLIKYFTALGSRQLERFELNDVKQHIVNLMEELAKRDGKITSLNHHISNQDLQIAQVKQTLIDRDGKITSLNHHISNQDLQIAQVKQTLIDWDGKITSLNHHISNQDLQIAQVKQTILGRDSLINELLSTTSWRLTKPLRVLGMQVLRAKLLFKSLTLANTHTGDVKKTLSKLIKVYQREGLLGIRLRVKFLLERDSLQQSDLHSPEFIERKKNRDFSNHEVVNHHQSVDVIVCVHNALEDVKRCLESIMRHTYPPFHLIIVDDGSGQETKCYLEKFIIGQSATLIRNEVASGYTKAANSGMRTSNGDFIVLINSDTIVPPKWLDRQIMCANSSKHIGMVGPLSNTASWQSIPKVMNEDGDWADNPLPVGWSENDYANELARISPRIYPRVGFLNGFCLLIKRELIKDIGLFDEEIFARGYGEENDYCLRATDRKWELAIADDCYVFHAQSKSYSHERRVELAKLAGEALANKHGQPKIEHNLSLTMPHLALKYIRQRSFAIEELSSLRNQAQISFEGKRVLFLLPAGNSGGGGNIVMLEVAHMRAFGVDAWIANLEINRKLFEQSHPDLQVPILYLNTEADLINIASSFDAVIATLYSTVFWMDPLRKLDKCPTLGYYIQDFEPDFFEVGSADYQVAFASYTCIPNLRLFTKTIWNQQVLQEKIGVSADVIGPSMDIDRFHPSQLVRTANGPIKIVAMVRPFTPRRNPETTMRVLKRLALHFGSRIQITIFGVSSNNQQFLNYPSGFDYNNLGEINSQAVAEALTEMDIFLDCSLFQAMGLTAMEAMASGVAVVGPVNGGLSEIVVNEHNGLLVDTQKEDSIFFAVNQLISDKNLREKIQANALDVLAYSPEYSAYKILNCLFSDNHQINSGTNHTVDGL